MTDKYPLFKAIKKKDFSQIQELLFDSPLYQWHPQQEKSTFHQMCEFFDKSIFTFMFNKAQNDSNFKNQWHKKDRKGNYPQHLLAANTKVSEKEILEVFRILLGSFELNLWENLWEKNILHEDVIDIAKKTGKNKLVELIHSSHLHSRYWTKGLSINYVDMIMTPLPPSLTNLLHKLM